MQKQTPPEATKTVYPILRQIVNLIPECFSCGGVRNKGPLAGVHAVEPCRRAHLPAAHEDGVAQRRLRRGEAPRLQETPQFPSKWKLSFSRLAGVVRAGVWVRRSIIRLLEMYGTAGGWKSDGTKPKPLYLQGFLPFSLSPMGQHLAKSQEIPELGCNITCRSTLLR